MTPEGAIKPLLRQLLAVMEAERQALAGLDLDAITMSAASKTALCSGLEGAANDNPDEESLALLEAVRRQNEVNRQVRNLIAANVAARLDALTGAGSTYRAQGVRAGYTA